jgi:hypothetical protein
MVNQMDATLLASAHRGKSNAFFTVQRASQRFSVN